MCLSKPPSGLYNVIISSKVVLPAVPQAHHVVFEADVIGWLQLSSAPKTDYGETPMEWRREAGGPETDSRSKRES